MILKKRIFRLSAVFVMTAVILACGVSFDWGEEEETSTEAEMTLEAIHLEQTAQADQDTDADDQESATPTVVVSHETIPGNPGSPDVEKDDINTENTADTRTALGDSYRLGNFERPFTEDAMVYHPEVDLLNLLLSEGGEFYYFTFEMSGSGEDGFTNTYYGIQFDTDYDGRGDYLLWAKGTDSSEWVIDDVMLLEDANGNVGGSSPVVPDNNNGDGYERVIFGPNALDDPDVAWIRMSGSSVQLAVKKSYIDSNRWYWKGMADAGNADPSQIDYNDFYSEAQAGSPSKNSGLYPVGAINMVDSTCWIAFNLTPTGTEIGGCVQLQPTQPITPTDEPDEPDEPQLPSCCQPQCFQNSLDCCTICGCNIDGTGEFCTN